MKCTFCGGLDVRLSKRSPRFSFVQHARGYERYRCRDCRRAFWAKPPVDVDERNRRKRQRGWSHTFQTPGRRRVIEIALFVTMLVIFVLAIRYLISKGDAPGPSSFLFTPSFSSGTLLTTAEC
jgi:hypothetical protein